MSYQARTGLWINWDYGRVRGATVTLDARNSQILSSFLASFLTVVGVQLWRIVAYTVHQLRERDALYVYAMLDTALVLQALTGHSVDGLHRQQQLVWKNYSGPASSAWVFMKQMWAWRKHARHSFLRTAPFAILCAVYAVVFALLALFASSEITKSAGPHRLVKPSGCGYYNSTPPHDIQAARDGSIKSLMDIKSANSYVNSCYNISDISSPAVRCDLYRRPKISWIPTRTKDCLWPHLCGTTHYNFFPIIMDTDFTDSYEHWGINAPPEDRVKYRRVTKCAPTIAGSVVGGSFVTTTNVTNEDGSVSIHDFVNIGNTTSSNYTFDYDHRRKNIIGGSYTMDHVYYRPLTGFADGWMPNAPFNRSDADVVFMLFEPNTVASLSPITDPIFSTDVFAGHFNVDPIGPVAVYDARDPWSALACTEQYSLRNPNNNATMPLGPIATLFPIDRLGFNPQQLETQHRLFQATLGASINDFLSNGGENLLQATATVDQSVQLKLLPENQWETEVSAMFDTNLARMQQAVLEFAVGYANAGNSSLTYLNGQISQDMCQQQIISINDGTVSYSVLGLALTITLGTMIILVSVVIEEAVGWIQRTLGMGENRRRAWILDSGFQLYRQLCQSKGLDGQWYKLEDGVPVCDRDAKYSSGCTVPDDFRSLLGESAPTSTEASPFIAQDGVFQSNASMKRESTEYAGKTEPSVTL